MVSNQLKLKWAETQQLWLQLWKDGEIRKSQQDLDKRAGGSEVNRVTSCSSSLRKICHFKLFHGQKVFIGSQVILIPCSSEIHLGQSLWGGRTHQVPVQLHFIFPGLDGNSGQCFIFKSGPYCCLAGGLQRVKVISTFTSGLAVNFQEHSLIFFFIFHTST